MELSTSNSNQGNHLHPRSSLETQRLKVELEIEVAKRTIATSAPNSHPDFDIRGKLYELALEFAPEARNQERDILISHLKPKVDESGLDLAAGTGFLTLPVAALTRSTLYALDPSKSQLSQIQRSNPRIKTLCLDPDADHLTEHIPQHSLDFVTSLGGLHHIKSHERLFQNVRDLLKLGGRFVAADVCSGTRLARHFDQVVARKCLTGHTANWLNEGVVARLATQNNLRVSTCTPIAPRWHFESVGAMCLFFKALHAYDMPLKDIETDLRDELVVENKNGRIEIEWPLLLFELLG